MVAGGTGAVAQDGEPGGGAGVSWRDEGLLLRAGAVPLEGRRADAGLIRLSDRDVRGLLWCGEMYGMRSDLLAGLLGVGVAAVRQVHMRWRRAGLAETGRLGPGPLWRWLTRIGLEVCGLGYEARPPALGRLWHVHAAGGGAASVWGLGDVAAGRGVVAAGAGVAVAAGGRGRAGRACAGWGDYLAGRGARLRGTDLVR
jgi:hypothetical protein